MQLALTLGLLFVWAYAYKLHRENERLREQVRVGPVAYQGCHAPTGADVVICRECAARLYKGGTPPPPLYREQIFEWWAGGVEDVRCHNCERLIAPAYPKGE